MNRKSQVMVVAVASLAVLLAGCSSDKPATDTSSADTAASEAPPASEEAPPAEEPAPPAAEDITMSVWENYTTDEAKAWTDSVIAQFEASHPGVKVEVQHVQNEDFDGKLQTALNADDAPDIFMQRGGGTMKDQADAGQLLDLMGTAADSATLREQLGDAYFQANTIDGKLWAAPQLFQPDGIWYSKDLFTQAGITNPPTTMEELYAAIDALKAAGIAPIAVGAKDAWPAGHWYYLLVLRECSPEAFVQAAAHDFSNACFTKAGQDLADLTAKEPFNEGFLETSAQQGATSSAGLLANHKAAMELMGSWEASVTTSLTPDGQPMADLGWFPFPTIAGGEGLPGAVMGGGGGMSCSAKAPKDLCADFLALMNSPENQEAFYRAFGTIPLNKESQSVVTEAYNLQQLEALAQASYVTDFLDTTLGQNVGGALNMAVVELLAGNIDAAGVVKAMEDAAAQG